MPAQWQGTMGTSTALPHRPQMPATKFGACGPGSGSATTYRKSHSPLPPRRCLAPPPRTRGTPPERVLGHRLVFLKYKVTFAILMYI